MPLSTIYIARHGYRSNWLPDPVPEPPTGIDSDHVLAPHGIEQAEELAGYVLSLEDKPQLVFSSPFYRCLQTATPLSRRLGLDILVENGIGEWYKPNRDVIPEPATIELLKKFFDNINENWASVLTPSNKGETEDGIFQRTKQFWEKFIPLVNEKFPNVKSIVLVGHAASKIALGMSLMGYNSVRDKINFQGEPYLRAGACSLDKYELNPETNKWDIKMNGKSDFLKQGEEMNWHFNNKVEAGSDEDIRLRREEAARKQEEKALAQKEASELVNDEEIEEIYVALEVPNTDLRSALYKKSKIVHTPQTHTSFNNQAVIVGKNSITNRASYHHNIQGVSPHPASSSQTNNNAAYGGTSRSLLDASSTIASSFNPTSKIQIANIETETPYVRIDDVFFRGNWGDLVGTEVILDENGEVVGTVRDHIQLTRGELVTKEQHEKKQHEINSWIDINASKSTNIYDVALQLAKKRLGETDVAVGDAQEVTNEKEGHEDNKDGKETAVGQKSTHEDNDVEMVSAEAQAI